MFITIAIFECKRYHTLRLFLKIIWEKLDMTGTHVIVQDLTMPRQQYFDRKVIQKIKTLNVSWI